MKLFKKGQSEEAWLLIKYIGYAALILVAIGIIYFISKKLKAPAI